MEWGCADRTEQQVWGCHLSPLGSNILAFLQLDSK